MKKVILTSLSIGVLLFSGCNSINSKALDASSTIPTEDGYRSFIKTISMDEKKATREIRIMKSMIRSFSKTKRSRNMSAAAKYLMQRGQHRYNKGYEFAGMEDMLVARYNTATVEPSEVVEIKDTAGHPMYKKVSVELEEYDIVNGCRNGVTKLLSGSETRFLYYGAIKQNDMWKFYIKYPSLKKHAPGPADRHCRNLYYIGTEAHANLLASMLKTYMQKL